MKLIDSDALEHELITKRRHLNKDQVLDVAYIINKAPEAVVHCKDCKFWHEETGFCVKHSYFIDSDGMSCTPAESPNWTIWDADAFCSDGELKDADNHN